MARQSTKSKFIFCKMFIKFNICGSYNLTNNIYILPQKKNSIKGKEKSIHPQFFYFADLYIKKIKILPLKNIYVK